MDIVSYRGPHAPGGVSNVLQTAFYDPRLDIEGWWFVTGNRFKHLSPSVKSSVSLSVVSEQLIEDHSRYCNGFLWPIFHGFFHLADYDVNRRRGFRQLNKLLADVISQSQLSSSLFVHDYQLATLPRLVKNGGTDGISFFWHIPWPEALPPRFVEPVSELAVSILHADKIGFQTQNDADNFLRFCRQHLPAGAAAGALSRVEVAPVPIDYEMWATMSTDPIRRQHVIEQLDITAQEKVVLSVERADYTKGVLERLDAIECFLSSEDGCTRNVRFLQVAPRTRSGVPVYDEYWTTCSRRVDEINEKFQRERSEAITWVQEPMTSSELAVLYARADVMLITALADGLNLTAKEFAVCQQDRPGALLLSRGCGVFSEFGEAVFAIEPRAPYMVAEVLARALDASPAELHERMLLAQRAVHKNDSRRWLNSMHVDSADQRLANVL